jgi:hypothetical protein
MLQCTSSGAAISSETGVAAAARQPFTTGTDKFPDRKPAREDAQFEMAGLRSFQPIGVNCKEAAQLVILTGRYVCVAGCTTGLQGQFAFITQNGTELNVVNDAGDASRG